MSRRVSPGNSTLAVAYIRVSTEDQHLGPEAQRAAIERWAAAGGVQIAATFEDAGVGGGTPIEKRSGLLAALAALREHGAGILVAAKRDRLARDVVIAATLEREVMRSGAVIATADGASSGTGPEAELGRGISDLFAAHERRVIKARTKAALAVKKARGECIGTVPYGSTLAADGVHLESNPTEQAVIGAVLLLRASGLSLRAVVRECEAQGLLSRSGRPFGLTQIANMVASA